MNYATEITDSESVTIHVNSKNTDMVKNVKIGDAVHRRLSIKASEITAQKGDLCTAIIAAALDHLPEDLLRAYVAEIGQSDSIDDAFPPHKRR